MRAGFRCVLFSVALAGCGARSAIPEVDRALGASGAGSAAGHGGEGSVSSGSGGAGGEGAASGAGGAGGSPPCPAIVPTGDVVVLDSLPQGARSDPHIHALADGRVVVFHRWVAGAGSGPDVGIVSTVVDWTDTWPPAMATPVEVDPTRGWTFTLDREPSPYAGVVAGTGAAPPGTSYGLVEAQVGTFGPIVVTSAGAARALTARYGAYRYFVAMEEPGPFVGGPSYHLVGGWVHQPPNGIQYEGPFVFGCVDRPATLEGLETEDGWLLAQPGPGLGGCADDVGPSPPVAVTIVRAGADGSQYFGLSQPVASAITHLVLSPRGGGAWITYGLEPPPEGGPPRLEAIAADSLGLAASAPIPITPPGSAPYAFDAVSFGEAALVAAFIDDPANNPPDLTVVLADTSGRVSAASIEDPPILGGPREVRAHANAARGAILVAFSGPAVETGTAVYLARFGCARPSRRAR
jgi:hypothetical protein